MYIVLAVAGKSFMLKKTLESLSKCIKPKSYKETIIVENGEKYDTEKLCELFNKKLSIKYLYVETGNKSNALNIAISQIPDNELIFFTDDDGLFVENILIEYDKASKINKNNSFFGGPILPIYECKPADWMLSVFPKSVRGWNPESFKYSDRQGDIFFGINYAVYSNHIRKIGYYNTKLGPGTKPRRTGQEAELMKRLIKNGFKPVFIKKALAYHYVPKEKSTIVWAVNRRFQDGISKGIQRNTKFMRIAVEIIFLGILLQLLNFFLNVITFSRNKALSNLFTVIESIGVLKGQYHQRKYNF